MPKVGRTATGRSVVAAAPPGSHLTYYGGHVISNVRVVQVLYGSGPYESEVQNTAAPSIASFYGAITNSSYYDWLTEYNTPASGTNQVIGRGTFTGQIQITPSAGNNGSTIDDSQIQAELQAQISAGHLPTPGANTLLAVYFPDGKVITQGGSTSGVQFCAYHGTVAASGSIPEFYYSILPGFGSPGFSGGGCGSGTEFQNVTSVSSHELVEATTDAEVGLAPVVGPPLAWYDSANGEIGDICNGLQQAIVGGDGRTYTVQQEWSNAQNNCVVRGPAVVNDFSISASPGAVVVAQGGSATTTVAMAVTSGSAQTVSLSASGLPSGASASFSPTSVSSGGSSTLTLSTAASTAAGSYPITVTGTGTSATHSTTVSLTVNASGGSSGITNGGFETGTFAGWTTTATTSISTTPHSGSFAGMAGGTSPTNGDSTIAQTFTAPSATGPLTFWYQIHCPDTITYDWASATLRDNTANTNSVLLANTCSNTGVWQQSSPASMTGGHSYTLTLLSHDDNYATDPTYVLFDDVTLAAPPTADFTISASPGSRTVVQGGATSYIVSVAGSNGFAGTVSLSASGLPSGAAASFNPTSITTNGSSILSVSTGSSTPAGSYPLTITGASGPTTHSTSVSLVVTAPPPPSDFSISASPASRTVTQGSGTTYTVAANITSGAAQTVSLSASGLPAGVSATFSPTSVTSGSSASTLTLTTVASTPAGSYTFTVTGTGTSATHTASAGLVVNVPSASVIVNGGFETGSLSGWTATGSAAVSTTAHTGTYAAQVGSASPFNGDSTIAQTFTAPAGTGHALSFWYRVVCTDSVTYDWATATLKDNTSNTTSTVLARTCTNNGTYVQKSVALTGGHSYTLTLIDHDDNWVSPPDPTYTLYDDVSVS